MRVDPLLLVETAIVIALVVVGVLLLTASRHRAARAAIDLRFTPHAIERMAERTVAETDVRKTLARPGRVIATTYVAKGSSAPPGEPEELDSVRLEKDFRGRTLKVWVPPDWRSETPIPVKSVAWSYVANVRVPRSRVGAVIGRGGHNVRDLHDIYRVDIHVDDKRGVVRISGDDGDAVALVRGRIRRLAG